MSVDEARRRIGVCRETQGEALDLGGLGLDLREDSPLWDEIAELVWVKRLYLVVSTDFKQAFFHTKEEEKFWNYLDNLPVEKLSTLTRLEHLDLEGCAILNLPENLGELLQLRSIDISGSLIDDLNPLSNLTNLTHLSANGTLIDELVPLTELRQLKELAIANTLVKELAPLSQMTELRHLNLYNLSINSLAVVGELKYLKKLEFSEYNLLDFSPLENLRSLEFLAFSCRDVCDISALSKLSQLKSLHIHCKKVVNFPSLSELNELIELDLSHIPLKDLNPLTKLTKLESLSLDGTEIKDLSPISSLKRLYCLSLRDTKVDNLNPLGDLTLLELLYLDGVLARNFSPLKELKHLEDLSLFGTEISDLTMISGAHKLKSIGLGGTNVTDLSPLIALDEIEDVNCAFCSLNSSFKELWFKPSMRHAFFCSTYIPGIPSEITRFDCDLDKIRSYFIDLEEGKEVVRDIKLIILGNGRVGKTQICRRLRGEGYDPDVRSTHGIQITTASLDMGEEEPVRLQVWDFGGQDIYHGTHALFLKSSAIFVLVWTPEMEDEGTHIVDGQRFRNEPLPYWVKYVSYAAGVDVPLLVVQTRCDRPEDERLQPPVDMSLLEGFSLKQILHYSAKEDRKRETLDEALREAANWLQEKRGSVYIGKGWAKVKHKLEEMRDQDQLKDVSEREHRTVSYQRFCEMCDEGVSDCDVLLNYLHDTGIVFYKRGLFEDQIILDQAWALEAIYAVLDREKCYQRLLQRGGRFTRSDLGDFLWDEKYSKEEQKLFLGMMQSCGICFKHREEDKDRGIEAEYIAPDLLPEEPEAVVTSAWDDEVEEHVAEFRYDLLLPGLMRGIIAKIGQEAGLAAKYWRSGVYAYEATTGSKVLIEQVKGENWSGVIHVRTQKGQAGRLLGEMVRLVEEHGQGFQLEGEKRVVVPKLEVRFEPEPGPEYFVSYKIGEREDLVDQLCEKTKAHGIRILRDKDEIKYGESIDKYMKRLAHDGDVVFVILSDAYLKSPYCMYELSEIYRTSKDDEAFRKRVRAFTLGCAKIKRNSDILDYAGYWQQELQEIDEKIEEYGVKVLGNNLYHDYKLMLRFCHEISDIIATLRDMLQPQSIDELVRWVEESNKSR